ncbi:MULTISPECIES: Tn3 family transposase [unclassified Burkholderia]|uniref:Tn3 family transposase n=1 Tax=unclassified Burkholderia TaxID=2613784 RepID=UPI000F57F5AF|nr:MULTISPECIES: Tn3 family transposase [unclassified Burkholderia]RQR70540.1 hypothetical protein DIE10_36195 [Burkholderia sp. Bp9011]RQR83616.1 hypothetical protein DIE09_36210 [Burkholderia sp. Bp9010]RQS64162.1 hypothetical protein DID97_34665 [Burkholderia sp. Bp8977]
MCKEIDTTQFADLLIEMDAHTGFSETLLARRARDANELIAHGTDLDAKSVVAVVPQLVLAPITTAMRALEMPGRPARANGRVVEFQRTHPITELWGTGRHASSDSMSLDTSPHLCYTRVDPRRRTHAVGIDTHVLDQHGIVYNQPIVLNERQASVAIEGVLRHNESRDDAMVDCCDSPSTRTGTRAWGWPSRNYLASICVRACSIWPSASCIRRADLPSPKDWLRS